MPLKAKLVMPLKNVGVFVREYDLPITPFVGLGIRLDLYDIFNVDSVVVGDNGCDVTCIGRLEGVESPEVMAKRAGDLGFEPGLYP